MFRVTFTVYDWYDEKLSCKHEASFDNAFFLTLKEIEEWEEATLTNGRGRITRVINVRTGNEAEYVPIA